MKFRVIKINVGRSCFRVTIEDENANRSRHTFPLGDNWMDIKDDGKPAWFHKIKRKLKERYERKRNFDAQAMKEHQDKFEGETFEVEE